MKEHFQRQMKTSRMSPMIYALVIHKQSALSEASQPGFALFGLKATWWTAESVLAALNGVLARPQSTPADRFPPILQ